MNNNDVLRRLRYALDLSNPNMISIFARAGEILDQEQLLALLAKEEDASAIECTDAQLAKFLDGLVLERRGPRSPDLPAVPISNQEKLSNNAIIKKLRIALQFNEADMLDTLALGGTVFSRSELGAIFRNEQHRHYRPCGDQVLRHFLSGLTEKLRR